MKKYRFLNCNLYIILYKYHFGNERHVREGSSKLRYTLRVYPNITEHIVFIVCIYFLTKILNISLKYSSLQVMHSIGWNRFLVHLWCLRAPFSFFLHGIHVAKMFLSFIGRKTVHSVPNQVIRKWRKAYLNSSYEVDHVSNLLISQKVRHKIYSDPFYNKSLVKIHWTELQLTQDIYVVDLQAQFLQFFLTFSIVRVVKRHPRG